ncbi:MAG: S8 family serine peptidase [Promethearchaeota archaeon]
MIRLKRNYLNGPVIMLILLSFLLIFPLQSTREPSTLPPENIEYSNNLEDVSSMSKIDDSLLTMLERDMDKSIDVIISFEDTVSQKNPSQILKQILGDDFTKLDVKHEFEIIDAVVVNTPLGIVPVLAENDFISGIWEDKKVFALNYSEQTLHSQINAYLDESASIIGADALWALGIDGSGITIAVVDTGIDDTHPDLNGKVIAKKSFVQGEDTQDYDGHGTHVAGIVAGTGVASSGKYKGIAPGASLINSKALDKTGAGTVSDVIKGIEWASDKADIICLSLGAPGSPNDPLAQAVNTAVEKGIVVCAAVGNDGDLGYLTAMTPSIASKAISVGATVGDLEMAPFSSKGFAPDGRSDPDIVAPGYQITSAASSKITSADYITWSGTSFSTPMIAGAAALLLDADSNLTPEGVKAALLESATDLDSDPNTQGAGLANVEAAYQLIQANDDLVTVTPSVLPSAPFAPDGIMFPGDAFAFNVEIISNESLSQVTISVEGLAWFFIKATPSSLDSVDRYTTITVTVIIPPTVVPFTYSGRLVVKEGGQEVASSKIDLNVRAPLARVLWDLSHDADGYFGYYYGDSPYSMFYKYYEILTKQGIDLDIASVSLTGTLLSGYDLLILPDPEKQLQNSEISAIQNFVSSGGDLFVLANVPASIIVDSIDINDVILDFASINKLTAPYGITCLPIITEDEELTLSTHAVTRNVASVYYLGCALNVESPAQSIGMAGSYDVLAVWESGLSKVLVFGSEVDFWDLLIDIDGYSHIQLARNCITWLTFPSLLFIVYLVLIVIPVVLVGIFLYRRSKKQF